MFLHTKLLISVNDNRFEINFSAWNMNNIIFADDKHGGKIRYYQI